MTDAPIYTQAQWDALVKQRDRAETTEAAVVQALRKAEAERDKLRAELRAHGLSEHMDDSECIAGYLLALAAPGDTAELTAMIEQNRRDVDDSRW